MARLRRQVEQKILAGEQVWQGISAPNVGYVDRNSIAYISDIGEIAAILGDHAVDEQNFGPERDETPSDRGADQTQAAGNHRAGTGIGIQARMSAPTHSSSLGRQWIPRLAPPRRASSIRTAPATDDNAARLLAIPNAK
jgi:hypothetical protein